MAWQWKLIADLQGTPGDVSLYGPAWAPQRNVPSTADLNTFKTPGVHRIPTTSTGTILNLPAGMMQAGIFENLLTGTGTDTWWAQRITQHGNSPRMWWRSTRDLVGGWNDWEEVLTDGGSITELHVFLAVGQSNMSGRGAPSGGSRDPENPRIMQYGAVRRLLENATVPLDMHDTATGISPATTFARAYLKSQPANVGVLIIPAAHGSTGFTTAANTNTWTPGAASAGQYDLPALAVTQTNEAVTAAKAAGYTVSVEGILWHQGENNSTMSQSSYAANLDALIGYFRAQLSNSKLPFIVGQMSPEGIEATTGRPNIDAAHQDTPNRVAYTGFAPATRNGYNTGDTTHLSRVGVEFLGRNYVNGLNAARTNADLKPRVGALEGNQWLKPADNVKTTLDDYLTPGKYPVTKTGVANRPIAAAGDLTVSVVNGMVLHKWTTTESEPREYLRALPSGGVWSAWSPANWRGGSVSSTDSLDNYLVSGTYDIPNGATGGKPFPGIGKVDVWSVGSITTQVILSLESRQRQFVRQRNGGVWSAWQDLSGPRLPTRSAIGTWAPTIAPTPSGDFIAELSLDRTVGFNSNHSGGRLKETRDGGVTWTDLKVFTTPFIWVRQLANGELLACTTADPDPRDLWLSSGYGTGTVTWSKVLTASAPYVTFNTSWGFSSYKNIVLVAEYGAKLPTWNGATVTQNARYVYMSLDSGKTWTTVFDLNTYLTGTQGRSDVIGQHVHGVCWDPYWDRIWVTFGDDTNGTVYSDNLGGLWKTAYFGSATNSPYQAVGIVAMPKAILFGTDGAPNGVQRIDRAAGKNATSYTIEQAYTIPGDDGTTRTNLCQAIRKIDREGDDGPVLMGFSSETNAAPSFIVGTYDGFTFKLLWQDAVTQAAGFGLRTIAGPTLKGELIVGANDQRTAGQWTKMTGSVPVY